MHCFSHTLLFTYTVPHIHCFSHTLLLTHTASHTHCFSHAVFLKCTASFTHIHSFFHYISVNPTGLRCRGALQHDWTALRRVRKYLVHGVRLLIIYLSRVERTYIAGFFANSFTVRLFWKAGLHAAKGFAPDRRRRRPHPQRSTWSQTNHVMDTDVLHSCV